MFNTYTHVHTLHTMNRSNYFLILVADLIFQNKPTYHCLYDIISKLVIKSKKGINTFSSSSSFLGI